MENGSNPLDPSSLPKPKLPELIHRWAFDESGGDGTVLVDSIGGADGVIEDGGPNDGSVEDGRVTLPGGARASTDFVRLPSNLLSSLNSATIETWTTYTSQNWSRVFSAGSATNNVMHMSFSRALIQTKTNFDGMPKQTSHFRFWRNPNKLFNEQVHWVVTVDNENGAADQTNIIIYKNGEPVKSGATTNKLSGLNDTDFFLGRSQWNDAAAMHHGKILEYMMEQWIL